MLVADVEERKKAQDEDFLRGIAPLMYFYFCYLNPDDFSELLVLVKFTTVIASDCSIYFHCPMLDREWLGYVPSVEDLTNSVPDFRMVVRNELRTHLNLKPKPELECYTMAPALAPNFCARQKLKDFKLLNGYWLPELSNTHLAIISKLAKR